MNCKSKRSWHLERIDFFSCTIIHVKAEIYHAEMICLNSKMAKFPPPKKKVKIEYEYFRLVCKCRNVISFPAIVAANSLIYCPKSHWRTFAQIVYYICVKHPCHYTMKSNEKKWHKSITSVVAIRRECSEAKRRSEQSMARNKLDSHEWHAVKM